MHGIVRGTGIVSAPHLKDILLREAHIFMGHELGLDIHVQRHQDEHEGKDELQGNQCVAQAASFHAGSVGAFEHQCGRLGSGIQCRSNTGSHGRKKRYSQRNGQNAEIVFERNGIRHIRCPGRSTHHVDNQAGKAKSHQRNKPCIQQLPADERPASFAQDFPGIDVLDAERNLCESEVDEVDNSDENQQNGDSRQRDGNGFVGGDNTCTYIALKVGVVQVAKAESLTIMCNLLFRHSFKNFRRHRVKNGRFRCQDLAGILQFEKSLKRPFVLFVQEPVSHICNDAIVHAIVAGRVFEDPDNAVLVAVSRQKQFTHSALFTENHLGKGFIENGCSPGCEFLCRALHPFKRENR